MESPAYPQDRTLKEEAGRIRGLEVGPPIDMQKVLIGSRGSWVSKRVWESSLGARFALGLLLGQMWEVKIAQTLFAFLRKKNPVASNGCANGGGRNGDGNGASGTEADFRSQKLRPCLPDTLSFTHFPCA